MHELAVWEPADIVKSPLQRSQMLLGSAQIASVIIFLKSGMRLPRFMPGAAPSTAFSQNLPVTKEDARVGCVSTGARFQKAEQAFVAYVMSGAES